MKHKVIIAILLLLILPVTLLLWGFCLPMQYDSTFMGELKYKQALLETAEGPRIVLVGGSGAAFGVDSALVEEAFPEYHVVNYGMYAALGTTVMLDLSEDLIREGDIVILMPEQERQTLSDFFDPAILWQGVDGAYGLLSNLSQAQLTKMAGQFPYFAAQKMGYLLEGQPPQPQGVYSRASFNVYGDVASTLCAQNIMTGGFDPTTPIRFDKDMVTDAFIERVNRYGEVLQDRGATVWYGFCPMNALAIAENADVDGFCQSLQEKLVFPLLGDPHSSILDPEWFYDTNFHLNSSGKTVYTRILIRNIKAMLLDSSPTQIALPVKPPMAAAQLFAGTSEDAACFVYEERDGAAIITGLSQEGKERESLTVPALWNDLPVVSIAENAFSGGSRLQSITLQENIQAIMDGAFAGCPLLTEIILLSADPSACRVGPDLLSGTAAMIYVPPDALSDYRTNYFWSVYASRILAGNLK